LKRVLKRVLKQWTRFPRRDERESALDKELQFHIEEKITDLRASGLTEQEARRRVRLEFGGMEQVKEECRDVRNFYVVDRFVQDVRYALRSLGKTPGFVAAVIGTLALGIGANTAIFSLISAVLLRPLPFLDPAHLVQLNESDPRNGVGPVSYQDLEVWRNHTTSFDGMFAYGVVSTDLRGVDSPERIATVRAEPGLLQMLGVQPIAGRTFREDDPSNVAVIGAGLWKRRFGGDPSCIGRKVILEGESYTVIGIMPAGFQFPYRTSPTDLWIPWAVRQWKQDPRLRVDFVVARLKPGAAIGAARSELDTIEERLANRSPDGNERPRAVVTPLSNVIVGSVRPALLTLWGAVGAVLLIACANVMNLLLARGAGRTHELALRAALGASRGRLIQQLLTESVLMSVAGATAGLLLASFSTDLLLQLASSHIPRLGEIGFDWRVFAFLMVAGVGAGILFGLLPALAASRLDMQTGLKDTSRLAGYGASGWSGRRLRDGLVVAEIAMAFVLVIGAGLMLRAFLHLQNTPTGFVSDNVLTLHMSVSLAEYEAPGSYGRYLGELEDRIGRIPGVQGVGSVQYLPLQNWGWTGFFSIPGRSPYPPGHEPRAELRFATPGYFTALGIPIRRGRAFNAHDTSNSQTVILINEALSRRYFPNEDPVGQSIDRGTIIGVVGDVRQSGLDRPATPEIYNSLMQNTSATSDAGVSLVIRSRVRPEALANAVRNAIHQVNPNQTVFSVKTMSQVIAESLGDLTLYLWLIGFFAGLAILLAITGTYGVVSYAAACRTREFAIRVALGADRRQISKLVLGHGSLLLALGLAVGAAGALALTGTLTSLSSSVTSPDAATLAFVGLLLAAVALAACLIPARRAMRVDPNISLKYE